MMWRLPAAAFGDEWWSITNVAPALAASTAEISADARIMSASSWRSRFHQILCSTSTNVVGAVAGGGMPRASAE